MKLVLFIMGGALLEVFALTVLMSLTGNQAIYQNQSNVTRKPEANK